MTSAYFRCAVTCGSNTRNSTPIFIEPETPFPGGIYTIDPTLPTGGVNFNNFDDAKNAISCGISGEIVFKIKAGTYTGRFEIGNVLGASDTSKVIFDGGHADSVILTYTGVSPNNATVVLNGANHIVLKNLTIENKGTSNSYGVFLTNNSNYNTIDSCKILMDTTATVSTIVGILASNLETSVASYGNTANYTTVSNCYIRGGYYGVRFNGTSTTVRCIGNYIIAALYCNFIACYIRNFNARKSNGNRKFRFSIFECFPV